MLFSSYYGDVWKINVFYRCYIKFQFWVLNMRRVSCAWRRRNSQNTLVSHELRMRSAQCAACRRQNSWDCWANGSWNTKFILRVGGLLWEQLLLLPLSPNQPSEKNTRELRKELGVWVFIENCAMYMLIMFTRASLRYTIDCSNNNKDTRATT